MDHLFQNQTYAERQILNFLDKQRNKIIYLKTKDLPNQNQVNINNTRCPT